MGLARCLAAAQTLPVPGRVSKNVEQHVRLAKLAAEERAQILVFPELSLTGYELELASELSFSEDDARLAPLVDVATALAMTLVVGAPVRLGTELCIGAFILGPERAVDVYTKHHLGAFPASASVDGFVPPPEVGFFRPGSRNPLVNVAGSPAALAVCSDTGRSTHAQTAAERGAKAYLASMFVIPSEYENDRANLVAHATRHAMSVVFSNYGGPTGGLASAGRSAIWSERGECVAALDATGAGVVVATEGDGGWVGKARTLG